MILAVLFIAVASVHADLPHGGLSLNSRTDDGHGNYAFKYDILDPLGAKNGRHEEGDAYGNKRGYYHITDIDGRSRRVDYIADEHGFRAVVQTNEPGTATSEPAGVVFKSTQDGVIHDAPYPVALAPPPKPIHTVYTSDLLPQPQVVRLAVPIRRTQPRPIPFSQATRIGPVITRTRIVPASPEFVGPYVSHHSRIVPAAPLEYSVPPYSHTRINEHEDIGINNRGPFVSYRIIPRSHHSYLPVRPHFV